ncbi:MAG: calcium-binding protein, partial [Selenomonadaceae bacterium]|nr:calcium-binding protein [Selenomonadaceae bacterium]
YNFSSQDTISLSGGYYTRETVRNDVIVSLVSGGAITFSGAKNKTIHILGGAHSLPTEIFSNGDDYYENSTASTILNALAGNDKIKNTVSYVTINGGAGNDYLYGFYSKAVIEGGDGFGAYSTISGGAGDDTIYMERGQYRLYQYSEGDGNDIILGFNTKNTLNITDETISNASVNGSDVIFIVGNGSITLEDYAEKSFYLKMGNDSAVETIISSGFVIPPPYGWKYGKSSKTNTNTAIVTATLKTAEDIDLTENYGEGVKTVDGSKTTNGIEFIGNDLGNSIKGGKGADVIYGGAGNDTVSLGAGNDTYIYSGGKDLIQDYAVGQDLIKLEAELQSASLNGSNLVITTDEGKVTVKSVKNKTVTVVNSANETLKIVNEYSTKETILPDGWKYGTSSKTNTNAAIITATLKGAENIDLTEDYGDGVEKVDGSKISGGVEIYGNNLNNSLKGGKGNDILDGGSGNDILISGAGDDTLIYSGGDDTITDYTANHDVIQIDTQEIEILSVETVSANMVYYTDAGNLTVKKGKGKKIELVDQNGDAIKISSINKNVAEDFWFLGSGNNFETCAIDSITEAKYSVTEIQPTEDKTFAQVSVLAYSEDK